MTKKPNDRPLPYVFRAVASREIDDLGHRMMETLECGHDIFFQQRLDAAGQGRWYDENGHGISFNTKTRRCWQCETEAK